MMWLIVAGLYVAALTGIVVLQHRRIVDLEDEVEMQEHFMKAVALGLSLHLAGKTVSVTLFDQDNDMPLRMSEEE